MKTARVISETDLVPHRAAGYQLVNGELKNQDWVAPTINTTADGALYLSLEDYIAWDRGLRAGALLKPESWARVYEAVRLNSGNTYPYGFGWDVEEVAGQKVYRHGGAWQGFETHIARFLGDDLTIIVLANLADAEPGIIVDAIAATFNPALARPAVKPIRDTEPEVTARLVTLLGRVGLGSLGPAEFSYVPNGYFPGVMDRYRTLMQDRAAPRDVELLERTQLGDDRIYHYLVIPRRHFDVTPAHAGRPDFVSTSASSDRRGRAERPLPEPIAWRIGTDQYRSCCCDRVEPMKLLARHPVIHSPVAAPIRRVCFAPCSCCSRPRRRPSPAHRSGLVGRRSYG